MTLQVELPISNEIKLEILPTGEIRFGRHRIRTREELLKLFRELNIENFEDVEVFLKDTDKIKKIIGKDDWCG